MNTLRLRGLIRAPECSLDLLLGLVDGEALALLAIQKWQDAVVADPSKRFDAVFLRVEKQRLPSIDPSTDRREFTDGQATRIHLIVYGRHIRSVPESRKSRFQLKVFFHRCL